MGYYMWLFLVGAVLFLIYIIALVKGKLDMFLLMGKVSGMNGQPVFLLRKHADGAEEYLCSSTIRSDNFRLSCSAPKAEEGWIEIGEGNKKQRFLITIDKGQFDFVLENEKFNFRFVR